MALCLILLLPFCGKFLVLAVGGLNHYNNWELSNFFGFITSII
jgi:hypothetical protein